MPPPSKIDLLDEDTRRELEARIVANGFGGYVELAEWLTERGYSIGKSAVGAYGQKLERRLAAIKTSTEAAKLIAAAAPDDADDRSNAIMSLVQTEIFDAILSLQEATSEEQMDPGERLALLSHAAKNIATLSRASVNRNKWALEVRETARADLLREQDQQLEAAVQSRGMTADQAAFWREQFLKGQ